MKVGTSLERLLTRTGYVLRFRLRCPASREKIDNRFESAGDSDFAEDVLKVCFDGIARKTELVRHLLVRLAEDQQIDDLLFPLSQVQPRYFSSRRRHTSCLSDWSSDVCSSVLIGQVWRGDLHARVSRADDPHEFLGGGILD